MFTQLHVCLSKLDVLGDDDKIACPKLRTINLQRLNHAVISCSLYLFVYVFLSLSPAFSSSAQVVEASW